ncbi:glycosyl hydrolase family 26, partial [Vibrio cholerae]
MEQLDNLGSDSGTFSSGFNATAFLQPGENEFSIGTVP